MSKTIDDFETDVMPRTGISLLGVTETDDKEHRENECPE
jgi:hypothetical protein